MSSVRPWWRSSQAMLALGAIMLVVVAELTLGRARGAAPDLVLFLGRFHPLVVHLPIGIFVLVALGEACTLTPRFRSRLDPVFGLVLPVVVASALAAFVLGLLLARSGDYPAQALSVHRRLAFVAVVGSGFSLAAWAHQAARPSVRARALYRALLFGSLGVMSLGAHFGGTMTRGETYLSKYAPGPLKPLLGGSRALAATAATKPLDKTKLAEPLLWKDAVLPIWREHCVECHGPDKVKGGLRLDTLEYAKKGGESGAAIVAGSAAQSVLVKRMRLPVDDDDHMPPQDKPAVSPEKIALIEFWIDRGASPELRIRDALAPSNSRTLLEKALQGTSGTTPTAAGAPASQPSASSGKALELEKAVPPPYPSSTPSAAVAAPLLGATAILAQRCEKCHGAQKRKGKLRVDSVDALLAGGNEGPAVVPGQPGQSVLIQRVRLPLAAEGHMPPESQPQLSAREVSVLAGWIKRMKPVLPPSVPQEAPSSSAEEPKPKEAVTQGP